MAAARIWATLRAASARRDAPGTWAAFYAEREAARAAGTPVPDMPEVNPDDLADLLWAMHSTKSQPEATYPDGL
jgi:hypothetical protein